MCSICGGEYSVRTPVDYGFLYHLCPHCGSQPHEELDKEFAELYRRLDEAEDRSKKGRSA
ncbi:hypothetical protein GCM10011389_01050 [Pontibacillus salipaludis]|uniref:Uncharacterized protein n=1 Tax=Pontibacillus salipaludis TaxID=1697394 RepID=A0ABQ1PI55_9BACI|nr:hypothetical protein GCM10011389_01050 [Pontibacillus salipaludis]